MCGVLRSVLCTIWENGLHVVHPKESLIFPDFACTQPKKGSCIIFIFLSLFPLSLLAFSLSLSSRYTFNQQDDGAGGKWAHAQKNEKRRETRDVSIYSPHPPLCNLRKWRGEMRATFTYVVESTSAHERKYTKSVKNMRNLLDS